MASFATDTTGYNCNWIEDPPEDLRCFICHLVAREPRQHPGDDTNECGKIFCEACINKLSPAECPSCGGSLNTFKDTINSRRIKALTVNCNSLEAGCSWTGELSSLEHHLMKKCKFTVFPCPNECQENNEASEFPRNKLQQHLKKCPRRMYSCPHCKERGIYSEIIDTHLDTCPKLKVECPNGSCLIVVPRCKVNDHREVCEFEKMVCKYHPFGCTEMPPRKKLKTHEDDAQLHLNLTTKQVLVLTETVAKLQEKVQTKVAPMEFELNSFEKYKKDNKDFFSSPFYTSWDGYKMKILVCPGGDGDGNGTHVSVFSFLMRGVNDDSLDWPFLGTVQLKLLNQLEDRNHRQISITYTCDDDPLNARVTEDKGEENSFGCSQFISHAELAYRYNRGQNCQYLKNDKLIFRVAVVVPGK